MRIINHYATLRISMRSTPEQIKSAYRRLARELHPDLPSGDAEKFQKLADAYQILNDPFARDRHDRTLQEACRARGLVLCPKCSTTNALPKIPAGKVPVCGSCQAELPYTDQERRALESTALREQAIGIAADLGSEVLEVAGDFLHTKLQALRGRFGIRRRG